MTARRFGGAHSPGGAPSGASSEPPKFEGRPARQVNVGSTLLFFAPFPLLFSGIGEILRGAPFAALTELGAFALILSGAWLLREGLKAEAEYDRRKIARRPAFPRKIISAGLVGAGVFVANWFGAFGGSAGGMFSGVVFGGLAAAAHLFAFGVDPLRDKGVEGRDHIAADAAAEALERAEAVVRETQSAAERFRDRALEDRVDRLCAAARTVFRQIEDDPRDLRRARKFLTVYLAGARDATVKFADNWTRTRDVEMREKYESLLTDLEASFAKQRETLLLDDRVDLEVEIEVLQERLQQEELR